MKCEEDKDQNNLFFVFNNRCPLLTGSSGEKCTINRYGRQPPHFLEEVACRIVSTLVVAVVVLSFDTEAHT